MNTPQEVSHRVDDQRTDLVGLPGHSSHPIADKFTGGHNDSHGVSGPGAAALAATAAGAGAASGDYGSSRGDAVSGAYAGQGTSDALTGESELFPSS